MLWNTGSPLALIGVNINLAGVPTQVSISGLLAVWQVQLLPYAPQAKRALYAKLAKALFARFYAKLLIPRLGT